VSEQGAVERWLAWRYLATRQREGFVSFIAIFSLIGIALGVATLIVVLSVMGGFRATLIGRLIGMNGHIVVMAKEGMLQTSPELLAALRNVPEVKAVHLTLERQALVNAPSGQTRGALLRGVRVEDLTSREIVTKNIVMGELGAFDTRPGVVIGERLRQGLNVRIGDKITVTTQRLNEQGTIAPRYADYEVLASFLTKRYEFDNALVFVPLQMLQDDLEYDHRTVSSIDLDLSDPNLAPKVADTIRKALIAGEFLSRPIVSVNVKEYNSKRIEVLGEVARPGSIPLQPGMTLVRAISLSGGFTAMAAKAHVTVRRRVKGATHAATISVEDIMDARIEDPPLQAGDSINVAQRVM